MSLLSKNRGNKLSPCVHGNFDFCPHNCYQTEFELAISEMMNTKTPDTEGSLVRLLKYKQSEAREMTSELSEVLKEIYRIEERLAKLRMEQKEQKEKRTWNDSSS